MISEDARGTIYIQPSRVLTGSVSWDLESSCSFDHLRLQRGVGVTCLRRALDIKKRSLHRRKSDENMNKLEIVPIFIVCIRRYSGH